MKIICIGQVNFCCWIAVKNNGALELSHKKDAKPVLSPLDL
jgi:hypothetical protein